MRAYRCPETFQQARYRGNVDAGRVVDEQKAFANAVNSPRGAPALHYALQVKTNNPQLDKAMVALIHSESRGNPLARSPSNARGSTQVLNGTGADMAAELGLPWRSDLMQGSSQEAMAYQYQLGRRYLEKGLRKYGNLADAFRFYHGGYDQSGWGPVTNTYAAYNVQKMRQLGAA